MDENIRLQTKKTEKRFSPERLVREEYLARLTRHYGFSTGQIDQEVYAINAKNKKESGYADIVIWKSKAEKKEGKSPLIIVECKAEQVTIRKEDYFKGASFAAMVGAKFFVTANQKQAKVFSKIFKVDKKGKTFNLEEILNIPKADVLNNELEVNHLLNQTLEFAREDFSRLLFRCHNIIRNNDKLSPEAAFDEISKILFIKTLYERENQKGLIYSLEEYVSERAQWERIKSDDDLPFFKKIFDNVKKKLKNDDLFESNETIKIRESSFESILKELEKYNLATTSDDIKGIAFEQFLGRTFRGELGQFFTPRTIVDYMVDILDPKEGEVICDPCCGSGGFLIKTFEHVKIKIEKDIQEAKEKIKLKYYGDNFSDLKESEQAKIDQIVSENFNLLNSELDLNNTKSRLRKLSFENIFGTDANARMARTSKMNMIMHGDGHGGVHHHDGLLNVNGVFDGRFDLILTNPPFGARVERSLKITEQDKFENEEKIKQYTKRYGRAYTDALNQINNNINKPILNLFETGEISNLTETLFIERCLNLLKPGGRMGIVLPEGVLNNKALNKFRAYVEKRAYIINVTSIPQDVFIASGATIKPSILFLKKKENRISDADYDIIFTHINDAGITSTGARSAHNEFPKAIELIKDIERIGYKAVDNEIVKIGKYSKLKNWSVSHNLTNNLVPESPFPLMTLSSFLIKNRESTTIDDNKEYKRITIKINNNGITLRNVELGKNIGTKRQTVVREGQFAISKIDARNGAIGLIPGHLDGAIVTPDFLTFSVNNNVVLSEYFEQLTSTKQFVDLCSKMSSGSTNRQRLNESLFLNTAIPVPPIPIQRDLIKEITKYKKLLDEATIGLRESKDKFAKKIFV